MRLIGGFALQAAVPKAAERISVLTPGFLSQHGSTALLHYIACLLLFKYSNINKNYKKLTIVFLRIPAILA